MIGEDFMKQTLHTIPLHIISCLKSTQEIPIGIASQRPDGKFLLQSKQNAKLFCRQIGQLQMEVWCLKEEGTTINSDMKQFVSHGNKGWQRYGMKIKTR